LISHLAIAVQTSESRTPADHAEPHTTTFRDLGLADHLVAALDRAGFAEPFPIQAMTIPDAIAGRDVSGKAKTGSGKTLAYGLPVLQRTVTARKRRPRALVLVPTRELALQVTNELAPFAEASSLWVGALYGGASIVRQIKDLHAGIDIAIATPGRLNDLLERKEMSVADVETVVIDEADQMADMGFLPQVRQILDRIENDHQTLLFSATLDGTIGTLVRDYQHDPVRYEVESPTISVETLDQRFIGVERPEKVKLAASICNAAGRSMVFVRTKHGADRLARQLSGEGVEAAAIHGGLNQRQRERTLSAFSAGKVQALVATNVAARGIHINDVDTVLHYDIPEDGKTYLHRSGRTARAGARGLVVTLVGSDEARDVRELQREAGISIATVAMRHDDERLADLAAWEPPVATHIEERPQRSGGGRPGGFRPDRRPQRQANGRSRRFQR
jgi:superfamily II DNA/RNA helicase